MAATTPVESPPELPITFRWEEWLAGNELTAKNVMQYFSASPWYDRSCVNEKAIRQNLTAEGAAKLEGILFESRELPPAGPGPSSKMFLIEQSYRTVRDASAESGGESRDLQRSFVVVDGTITEVSSLHTLVTAHLARCGQHLEVASRALHAGLAWDPVAGRRVWTHEAKRSETAGPDGASSNTGVLASLRPALLASAAGVSFDGQADDAFSCTLHCTTPALQAMADAEARAAEITRQLPNGWRAVFDPDSNDYYFWNVNTNETSWDDPRLPKKTPNIKLPAGWEAVYDKESDDFFFWNTKTDETTWDPPAGSVRLGGAEKEAPVAPASGGGARRRERKKREVIMQGESYDAEAQKDFKVPVHPKGKESQALIRSALVDGSAAFLFKGLGRDEIEKMVMAFSERVLKPGEAIITQGDMGDNFYIVESGDFDIDVKGTKVATRGPGDSFGELALLNNAPRAASVIASTPARVWAVDRMTFRFMIAHTREDQLAEIKNSLARVPLLEPLTDEQLGAVAEAVTIMQFQQGDKIIAKGDSGELARTFYMIKTGGVTCTDIGDGSVGDVQLDEGSYFGERALLTDEPRAANVIAKDGTSCMVLDRKAFSNLLGPLGEVLDRNMSLRAISPIGAFSKMTPKEKQTAAAAFRSREYAAAGELIARGGVRNDTFFVIKQGSVRIGGGEPLNNGASFGVQSLLGDSPLAGDAVAAEPKTVCLCITRGDFEASLPPLADIQRRSAADVERLTAAEAAKGKATRTGAAAGAGGAGVPAGRQDVKFRDLNVMRTLGAGTFGRVKLVQHRPTGAAYALKVLQKAQIVAYGQQKNVMNERNVMLTLDHPFILKLVTTFKDTNCLYMLLELVQGGELFSLLANQDTGFLSSEHARFYAACVTSGLEAMHAHRILYRDLKPENMLIDAEGYIKIVDMGFAKVVNDRTYTLCGTPEYLAPELVLGKGHNKGVDYWALGVLCYEMVSGYSPFADESQDQMKICKKIVKGRVVWPSHVRDRDLKDLVSKLLVAKISNRLGCKRGGASDIRRHKWFRQVDWQALVGKRVQAPWRPPLRDAFDSSNFPDEYDDEEEVIEPYQDDGSGWDADF